nr:right-handed parallel beta-helix repeat-containing protein [bacterium]
MNNICFSISRIFVIGLIIISKYRKSHTAIKKLKNIFCITLVSILFLSIFFTTAILSFNGGSGAAGDPYQISTPAHLNDVRNFLTSHFIVVNDINLNEAPYNTGSGWEPIGTSGSKFQGNFDGRNKIISNLFISRSGESNIGLFGYTYKAVIQNVRLENVNVTGANGVGALVGYNDSSVITKSYTKGAVAGTGQVGGFVGYNNNYSNINLCFNTATVNANNDVGGFAGYNNNYSKIIDCFNRGNVLTATNTFGNFLGYNQTSTASIVSNCYSSGSVPTSGTYRGAFAGYNNGTISNSFWNKETSGDPALGAINGGSGITSCSGLVTSQMKTQNIFVDSGWNFTDTWIIDSSINDGYPYLRSFLFSGNEWYVSTTGNDANIGSSSSPFLTITKALSVALSGDRINIAAGTYSEAVVIDTDNISLIGADSGLTIINPTGDSLTSTIYGIYAANRSNLTIKNLRIFDCYHGVYFNNVDTSTVENVWAEYCGNSGGFGFLIANGSCSNTFDNCYAYKNYKGINFSNASYNILKNSNVSTSSSYGISFNNYSVYNFLLSNTSQYNNRCFYFEATSDTNTLTGNTAKYANGQGFNFENVKGFTVTGNTAMSNLGTGFYVNGSMYNNLTGNTAVLNTTIGFDVRDGSNNTLIGNTAINNAQYGIYLKTEVNSKFLNNKSDSNGIYGLYMEQNSNNNIFLGNSFSLNLQCGISLNSSSNNKFEQNDLKNNIIYQISLGGAADTFTKNNIKTSSSNPTYAVYNTENADFDFNRNYWNTGDSAVIFNQIKGTYASKVKFTPYRTSEIDTAIGADTVAPAIPAFIDADTAALYQTLIRWIKPSTDEDGTGLTGLAGYRLYRARASQVRANGDTENWESFFIAEISDANDTDYIDYGLINDTVYYYRIVAFDSHYINGYNFQNRSPYSTVLTVKTAAQAGYAGPNFYVNDTSQTNDSYCLGIGSDTLNIGNETSPFRTITAALLKAAALGGNFVIYIDAGIYNETVVISANNISLIGVDSSLTIIDPSGDSTTSNLYGIYASLKNNLIIKNLRVFDCYNGIYFNNVDSSIIDNVTVSWCGLSSRAGIRLSSGSDSNTISNCYIYKNYYGMYLYSSGSQNLITNCFASYNTSDGFHLNFGSCTNTFINNRSSNNSGAGFMVYNNSHNNKIDSNYISNNSGGGVSIQMTGANPFPTGNSACGNTIINNSSYGIILVSAVSANITNNLISGNTNYGVYISNLTNSYFGLNQVSGNTNWGFYITGASSADTFENNNWSGSASKPDSAVFVNGDTNFSFINNYWSSSDSSIIRNRIFGNGVAFTPYRASLIDTAIGADSVAPAMPAGASVNSGIGSCTVVWNMVTQDGNGGALSGLNGYKVYRYTQSDTNNWGQYLIATISASETSYYDTPLTNGVTYYYRVAAFDTHIISGT